MAKLYIDLLGVSTLTKVCVNAKAEFCLHFFLAFIDEMLGVIVQGLNG